MANGAIEGGARGRKLGVGTGAVREREGREEEQEPEEEVLVRRGRWYTSRRRVLCKKGRSAEDFVKFVARRKLTEVLAACGSCSASRLLRGRRVRI
jgi:hypothetical protein